MLHRESKTYKGHVRQIPKKGFSIQPEGLLFQSFLFSVTQQRQKISILAFALLSIAQAPCVWPLIKSLAKLSLMTQLQIFL